MPIADGTHWRDASRTPRFYFMDAYAALPLLFMFLHITLATFLLAIGCVTFFVILEKFNFTVPIFSRWFKATLAGPVRIAKPWWRE